MFSHEDSKARRKHMTLKSLEKLYNLGVFVSWWPNYCGGGK